MTKLQTNVTQFMLSAGQACPKYAQIPDEKTRLLRVKLIAEELTELADAFGVRLRIDSDHLVWVSSDPKIKPDLVSAVDATGDLRVVIVGCDTAMGIDGEPIDDEIHRSNMSKFIDGHRREDGKWIKGPSYSPANLQPIIDSQK